MDNFPDRDTKLVDFLRQHKSIAPPASSNLEDLLMSKIDLLPARSNRSWWQYIVGGIGIIAIGIVGVEVHQLMNPPEPSLAQLQQLNLYLEAHSQNLVASENITEDRDAEEDLDTDLLLDKDLDLNPVDRRS